MPLFTTRSAFDSGIVSESKSCQVGNNIWTFEQAHDNYFQVVKIDIDSQLHRKWSYPYRIIKRDFHICSSNGKIYLWISAGVRVLIEFNPVSCRFNTLGTTDLPPSNFFVLGDKMYIKSDRTMIVMSIDTFEIITTINLPIKSTDEAILLEMNGLVYMVRKEIIGIISIHQYDTDNGTFQQIMHKNEQERVNFRERFGEKDIFACGKNNKIYLTLVSRDKILINCFDVVTKQCDTMMDSYYGSDEVMDMFEREDIVYVISRRYLDIIIQQIEMNPSLETIALVNMAEMVVNDPRACHKECQKLVPHELRKRFNKIYTRREQLTSLGKMDVLEKEIRRLATHRDNEVKKLIELQQQMNIEREQLIQSMNIGITEVRELTESMGDVMDKFMELQYYYIKVLNGEQEEEYQMKYPNEQQIRRFEGLSHCFLNLVEQPRAIMSYTLPKEMNRNRQIERIAEIEEQAKQQKDKFISEQERFSEVLKGS